MAKKKMNGLTQVIVCVVGYLSACVKTQDKSSA